jgi:hypothetical protein
LKKPFCIDWRKYKVPKSRKVFNKSWMAPGFQREASTKPELLGLAFRQPPESESNVRSNKAFAIFPRKHYSTDDIFTAHFHWLQ